MVITGSIDEASHALPIFTDEIAGVQVVLDVSAL